MPGRYSPDRVRVFFDQYGAAEWDRFDRTVASRVSLELHKRFQGRWVHRGDRVLEVGAGPGRFTIELARIGARILVSDISPRQLELNPDRVAAAGCEDAVEGRRVLDVTDLSSLGQASFDVVTALGGPLSYVFDRAGQALDELLAAVRPGGVVLFSVMSRWGSIHQFLDGVLEEVAKGSAEEYRVLVEPATNSARPVARRRLSWCMKRICLRGTRLSGCSSRVHVGCSKPQPPISYRCALTACSPVRDRRPGSNS